MISPTIYVVWFANEKATLSLTMGVFCGIHIHTSPVDQCVNSLVGHQQRFHKSHIEEGV